MKAPLRVLSPLPRHIVERAVREALAEDLGRAGDITTDAIVPADAVMTAIVATRKDGRVAGLDLAIEAFRQLAGNAVSITVLKPDGSDVMPPEAMLRVVGPARAILTAERVALNFVGRLSGIATATREIVRAVEGFVVAVTCTRKTTPGLRALEKYAVRAGGGANHRFGLDDGVLIKDNHIAVAGGVRPAIERARAHVGHMVKIEVEVDTLDQLAEALACGVDIVLLDNMDLPTLARAVTMVDGRAIIEASGGVTAAKAPAIAAAGVDIMSAGWLTHSAPALDIGLDTVE